MDERTRLDLIVEAVRYCQRVKAMGMPPSCYSKALREPVHFLWERRGGGTKEACARFRSKAAHGLRVGDGALVYDHAIPFRYLEGELLSLSNVIPDSVKDVLSRHCVAVLITKEEDGRLNSAGLAHRMPDGWDGVEELARYRLVGIEVTPNVPSTD